MYIHTEPNGSQHTIFEIGDTVTVTLDITEEKRVTGVIIEAKPNTLKVQHGKGVELVNRWNAKAAE